MMRDLIYASGLTLTSPVWATQLLRTGKWRTDWSGRFGRGARVESGGQRLLIHAVSVGEVNAIRQLVQHFERDVPELSLIISSTTNTGFARATELFADRHAVVRFPLDFGGAVRRFLDRVRPNAVATVELELWPNFVATCAKRGIPVCVINGRLSENSFRGYRRIRPLIRSTFARVTVAAVQTQAYAERFIELGVPAERVRVLDTMKWDTAVIADDVPGAAELAAEMGMDRERPLVVAGSTGGGGGGGGGEAGEERVVMEAVLGGQPAAASQRRALGEGRGVGGAQLVLVPRKPERFEEVAGLGPMVRRSAPETRGVSRDVFLLDTMGELRKAYALADVVVVGRSFCGLGGSDPIEPVGLGKATVIGPDHANFAEVVEALREGGGLVVTSAERLRETLAELLADEPRRRAMGEAGRAVIRERQGATARHADLLRNVLTETKSLRI